MWSCFGSSNAFSAYVILQEIEWGLSGECWEAHGRLTRKGWELLCLFRDLSGSSAEGGYLSDGIRPTKKPHLKTVRTS